ncbi:MAG TPA: glycoside hydrolase family 172 protein [Acidimicrobiales bacterium]|nr:glycoside hydrolase family 172 protein [Acidimicrobiales bacterium]
MLDVTDLTRVSPVLDCRAVTFENPTGERGAGGTVADGRKGAPNRRLEPGERVTLADLAGPGVIRHIWMTFPPAPPEVMRAMYIEVFYDDMTEPSVSVPCVDFFGVPHGRPVPSTSALTAIQEGRGFNSFVPLAFGDRVRIEFMNGGPSRTYLYYQVDYTLEPTEGAGRLHATFRRQNPTVLREDFVIEEGLRGPGRFLGCVVGIRCLDPGTWYGEGEVKVFRDGDTELPTICGTGLEDYVGSAWGLGAHEALYAGTPLDVRDPQGAPPIPDYVGFYRWHVLDPIMFEREMKVTIQQIGYDVFPPGDEERLARCEAEGRPAGLGLARPRRVPGMAHGIVERIDDYCAVAFTVCAEAQAVPRLDLDLALADLGRLPYEKPNPFEAVAVGALAE